MITTHVEPTSEMISFFERRTREHIEKVARCLELLALTGRYPEELRERAKVHDASKFEIEERVPYIWLTEFHRCRSQGLNFEYPIGIKAKVEAAIQHHVTTNRHHYQYHQDPNMMSEVDLIEMVCDWTAMAQEANLNGGSAIAQANKVIGKKVLFDLNRQEFIYRTIKELDCEIAKNTPPI